MQQVQEHTLHHHSFFSIPCAVCTLHAPTHFCIQAHHNSKKLLTHALRPLRSLYVVWQVNLYPAVSDISLAMEVLPSGNRTLYTRLLVLVSRVRKLTESSIKPLRASFRPASFFGTPAYWEKLSRIDAAVLASPALVVGCSSFPQTQQATTSILQQARRPLHQSRQLALA